MKNVEACNNHLAKKEVKVLGQIAKEERGTSHKPKKPRQIARQQSLEWMELRRRIRHLS